MQNSQHEKSHINDLTIEEKLILAYLLAAAIVIAFAPILFVVWVATKLIED